MSHLTRHVFIPQTGAHLTSCNPNPSSCDDYYSTYHRKIDQTDFIYGHSFIKWHWITTADEKILFSSSRRRVDIQCLSNHSDISVGSLLAVPSNQLSPSRRERQSVVPPVKQIFIPALPLTVPYGYTHRKLLRPMQPFKRDDLSASEHSYYSEANLSHEIELKDLKFIDL